MDIIINATFAEIFEACGPDPGARRALAAKLKPALAVRSPFAARVVVVSPDWTCESPWSAAELFAARPGIAPMADGRVAVAELEKMGRRATRAWIAKRDCHFEMVVEMRGCEY